jgi:predicted dehydrogenase
MLFANGCQVIGFDLDPAKIDLAKSKGIEAIQLTGDSDPVKLVESLTGGTGADGVLITASTRDSSLISQAARMSRKRGRIILVGVTGLDLNRSEFYEKELTFQVSCSYGPGRYDDNYEQKGMDYPLPFVRWTEKRNFETVLQAISRGQIDVKPLISELVPLEKFQSIYGDIGGKKTIASILTYTSGQRPESTVKLAARVSARPGMGIIGAGNFTKMTMLPALKKAGAPVEIIASNSGVSGTFLAKKFGISESTTDYRQVIQSPHTGMVLITTRHNLHAPMVKESLLAGKDVFVEKPIALSVKDLLEIEQTLALSGKTVSVGFNRRFSPFSVKIKEVLGPDPGPVSVIATMNAGFIPPESWVHDLQQGGGRIVGEACHFVDLISFFTGSEVESVFMTSMGLNPDGKTDVASIHLKYRNGSLGVINYFSNGSKAYSKERIEVYFGGKTLIMDNFRKLEGFGTGGFSSLKGGQDKGHGSMFLKLVQLNKNGGEALISWKSIRNTHLACFGAVKSMLSQTPIQVESLASAETTTASEINSLI